MMDFMVSVVALWPVPMVVMGGIIGGLLYQIPYLMADDSMDYHVSVGTVAQLAGIAGLVVGMYLGLAMTWTEPLWAWVLPSAGGIATLACMVAVKGGR